MGDSHQLPDRAYGSQSNPLKRHPAVLCFRLFALASPPQKCRVPCSTLADGVCTHRRTRVADKAMRGWGQEN